MKKENNNLHKNESLNQQNSQSLLSGKIAPLNNLGTTSMPFIFPPKIKNEVSWKISIHLSLTDTEYEWHSLRNQFSVSSIIGRKIENEENLIDL